MSSTFAVLRMGVLLGVLSPAVAQGLPSEMHTGTLNLVLANRNGIVIATDSRKSNLWTGEHWDDSQKLFRVNKRSAIAIAGFAEYVEAGTPLDLQVAALLREEFSKPELQNGKRDIHEIAPLIRTEVGNELTTVGAVLATARPRNLNLDFRAIAAGFDKHGKPTILTLVFEPTLEKIGPYDLLVPTFDLNTQESTIDHFVATALVQFAENRQINWPRSVTLNGLQPDALCAAGRLLDSRNFVKTHKEAKITDEISREHFPLRQIVSIPIPRRGSASSDLTGKDAWDAVLQRLATDLKRHSFGW